MTRLIPLVAVVSLFALAPTADAQTKVYGFAPADTADAGVWFMSDVRPGGTSSTTDLTGLGGDLETGAPLPIGAAYLTTDLTNAAKAEVAVLDAYGVAADVIPTLQVGYSWLKATSIGQNLNAAASIKLTFYNENCDETPDGDCEATLIYEAYQNGFGNHPTTDTWQRSDMDATTGGWWTNGGFGVASGGGGCGAPTCPTLSDWLGLMTPDFAQSELVAVSVGVGSYNVGQQAYFDLVTISHGGGYNAEYDFEPPFDSVGDCVSSLVGETCSGLNGKDRADCIIAQRDFCFDLFDEEWEGIGR